MKVVGSSFLSIFCLVNTLLSFSLFLKSYFPLKSGLGGYASTDDIPDEPLTGRRGMPDAKYNRLVLLVIDALRTDFVLGDTGHMPVVRQLLDNGRGVSFTAKTHLPTVTLPRIKAITSGSIPGFVDVMLNFGSTALTDDNLITQLKLAGKAMTFFGDDTWLRLFPDHFTRYDGTTSFFVTDFTEVDVNVTRHLNGELAADDWDAMVLHYLGLDHIGHLYGPTSSLVRPKLWEMDAVVNQIYTAMKSWGNERPSVLVICGDHGMSDQGGHGGASPGETSVPVIVLSPHTPFQTQKVDRQEIQQIDLCPTLSALLGFPIPRNNLGRVEVSALPSGTPVEDKVRLLQLNAAQVVNILEANVKDVEEDATYLLYQDAFRAHSSWLSTRNSTSKMSWGAAGNRILADYQDVVKKMSQHVSQASTSYDIYGMSGAIVSLQMNLIIQILVSKVSNNQGTFALKTAGLGMIPIVMVTIFIHVTVCTSQDGSDILCGTSLLSISVQLIMLALLTFCLFLIFQLGHLAVKNIHKGHKQSTNVVEVLLAVFLVCHSLFLLSSSFVEEEHQIWYFITSTLHIFFLFTPLSCFADCLVHSRTSRPTETLLSNQDAEISPWVNCQDPHSLSSSTFTRIKRKATSEKEVPTKPMQGNMNRRDALSRDQPVNMVAALMGILFLLRVLRGWNQTGNKWLDRPDIGDWLVRSEHIGALSTAVAVSLVCVMLTRLDKLQGIVSKAMFACALASVYLSKAAPGSLLQLPGLAEYTSLQGVVEARMAYLFILGVLISNFGWRKSATTDPSSDPDHSSPPQDNHISESSIRNRNNSQSVTLHQEKHDNSSISDCDNGMLRKHRHLWETVQVLLLCVMCLLLRPHNIPVLAMLSALERLVCDFVMPWDSLRPRYILLYCLFMGQAFFFFQGNSNSLSTVDVSAGFTALHDYQPVVIGIQMFVSTYAGVIFWLCTSFKYITMSVPSHNTQQWLSNSYLELCSAALLTRALPLAVYTVLATLMRYHLFVWTVFSPKLLFEGTLSVVVCCYCASCFILASRLKKCNKVKL